MSDPSRQSSKRGNRRMRRVLVLLVLLGAMLSVSIPARAFALLDPNTWPPALNPHNWPFDLFPVPEVATNPNGGVTYGVLLAFLFKDQQTDISSILAPDVNNDTVLGFGGTVRYFAYPSEDTQWYALVGAQEVAGSLTSTMRRVVPVKRGIRSKADYTLNATPPTAGILNDSPEGGDSNYTTEQFYIRGKLGWNITKTFQLALVARPRYVRILQGDLYQHPSNHVLYPNAKGVGGGSEIYGGTTSDLRYA